MERPLDFIPFKISKETVWKVEQLVGLSGSEKASMSSTLVRRAMAAPSGIPGARGTEIFSVDAALDRRSAVSPIAQSADCFSSSYPLDHLQSHCSSPTLSAALSAMAVIVEFVAKCFPPSLDISL